MMKRDFTSVAILLQTCKPWSNHGNKTSENLKSVNILETTWPAFLKLAMDTKNKGGQKSDTN